MLLLDLAREIEEQSVFDAISTHAAPRLPRSDLIRFEDLRTRFTFGLRNSATIYQEAMQFKTLLTLVEDLDRLLKIGDEDATAYREAPIFNKYTDLDGDSEPSMGSHLGLTITSTPQGRFLYWNGMEPSECHNQFIRT
jgi:hypothetical protein